MNRRELLSLGAVAGGLVAAPRTLAGAGPIHRRHDRPLEILFLGGTGFVGPAVIDVAVSRGHQVTLFNRGETNPWLYTWLERLRGDRVASGGDLSALQGDRKWDVVIDTWQGSPLAVRDTAELLSDRVNAYFYISSIAVYQDPNYRKEKFDETAQLPPAEMPESLEVQLRYPVRKQLGEEIVRDLYGHEFGIFRAYGIQGTEATGRLSSINYWPVRIIAETGPVLSPGDGKDFTAWTDVRDLADFVVHCAENRIRGVYNVGTGMSFEQYLVELARLAPHEVDLRWAPAEFLEEQEVEEFVDVPGWVWRGSSGPGFFRASFERALDAGLRPRTVRQTFGPMIDAYRLHHTDHDIRDPKLSAEIGAREGELLRKLESWR